MRRAVRRALGLACGLTLLLVCGALLAVAFYPVDRLRPQVESRLSVALGLPVQLGRFSISIFGGVGVRVDRIQVGPPRSARAGEGLALFAEQARVRLALGDLLRRRAAIRGIDVWAAEIRRNERPVLQNANLRATFGRSAEGNVTATGSLDGRVAALAPSPPASATFDAELIEDRIQLHQVAARFEGGSVTARGVLLGFSSVAPSVELDWEGVVGESRATGTVACIYGSPRSDIRFDLTASVIRSVDVAPLVAVLSTARSARVAGPQAAADARVAPGTTGALRIAGVLAAARASIGALELRDLRADVKVEDARAQLQDVRFALYGGTQRGSLALDTTVPQLPFVLTSRLEGVDVGALAEALAPEGARVLEGSGTLDIDLTGNVPDAQIDRGSLRGTVAVEIRDGRMVNLGMLSQIAKLATRSESAGTVSNDTPFRLLSGTFHVEGAQARAERLLLESDDVNVGGGGILGLDGALDLDLTASLAPDITATLQGKAPALRHWIGPDQRLALPLRLAGSVREPSVRMDVDRAAGGALAKYLDSKDKRGVLRRILGGR